MSTRRIIDRATQLLIEGVPALDAIEQACEQISCGEGAKEAARKFFVSMAAKAETEVVAERRRATMKVV